MNTDTHTYLLRITKTIVSLSSKKKSFLWITILYEQSKGTLKLLIQSLFLIRKWICLVQVETEQSECGMLRMANSSSALTRNEKNIKENIIVF